MTDLQGHAVRRVDQSTSRARLDWVDYSKGIGIILVVFGHVWRGLYSASLALSPPLYEFVDTFIYSFHMPLFFFLSGSFAERSANRSAVRFVTDKTASIAYPYLLWSVLQGGMNVALSNYTNTPLSPSVLVQDILYRPYGQFWFLYVLMLANLTSLILYKVRLTRSSILALAVAGYGALASPGFDPPGVLRLLLIYFPYFALGNVFGSYLVATLSRSRSWIPAAVAGSSWLLISVVAGHGRSSELTATFFISLIGIGGVIAVSTLLDRFRAFSLIRRFGVATLPIYLAHIGGLAGCRIILLNVLHVRNVLIHLIAGMVAGLAIPFVLWAMVQQTRWYFLFTLKRPRSSPV